MVHQDRLGKLQGLRIELTRYREIDRGDIQLALAFLFRGLVPLARTRPFGHSDWPGILAGISYVAIRSASFPASTGGLNR